MRTLCSRPPGNLSLRRVGKLNERSAQARRYQHRGLCIVCGCDRRCWQVLQFHRCWQSLQSSSAASLPASSSILIYLPVDREIFQQQHVAQYTVNKHTHILAKAARQNKQFLMHCNTLLYNHCIKCTGQLTLTCSSWHTQFKIWGFYWTKVLLLACYNHCQLVHLD